MSKRIVVILLALGLVGLLTPPAVGFAYEREFRSAIAAGLSHPAVQMTLLDYQRGLYRSTAEVQVGYSEEVAERCRAMLSGEAGGQDEPTPDIAFIQFLMDFCQDGLRFEAEITHGPLVSGDGVRLALARMSTELAPDSGALADAWRQLYVPYLIRFDGIVNFDRTLDFETDVPALGWSNDLGQAFGFSGLSLTGRYDSSSGNLTYGGHTESLDLVAQPAYAKLSDLKLEGDLVMADRGVWSGTMSMGIRSITAGPVDGAIHRRVLLTDLRFLAESQIDEDGGKLQTDFVWELANMDGLRSLDLADLRVALISNFDLQAVKDYQDFSQRWFFASPEELQAALPELSEVGLRFLREDPMLGLEPIQFTVNGDRFEAGVRVEFDASVLPPEVSLTDLSTNPALIVGGLMARGGFHTPEALARELAWGVVSGIIASSLPPDAQVDPQEIDAAARQQSATMIDTFVAQGLIERQGGALSADFSFSENVLTVNGQPIPLGN